MIERSEIHILVFGCEGQVATELREARLPQGWSLQAMGRSSCDIASAEAVARAMARHRPTVVVNAAAYTAVDRAESERELAFAVNRDGPAFIARACADAGIPLIHLSTDYVFDGRMLGRGYREDDPVNPLSVYGTSKEAGERAIRDTWARHVILRTSWVYSPHGHNFVKTMLRLGRERPDLGIVGDQHGCPTAVGDIAAAILEICAQLAAGKTDGFGTFNLAGTGATTWFGFASEIFARAAAHGYRPPLLRPIATSAYPTPAARPANSVLDCSRLRDTYEISVPAWQTSLQRCLDQLLAVRLGDAA